jgi:glycosyltransferase involved in cell wall biosynthesis
MLSVILPTRNRAQLLLGAIDSLVQQTLPQDAFEVLVIDNGSTDETADVVREKARSKTTLRYIYEPEPGLHAGRHRGMLEACGDVLVFADDDIEAFPSWLSTIHEVFTDPEVAMVGGNNRPMFLEQPPAWLLALWNRPHPLGGRALPALSILELDGEPRSLSPYFIWGCNFAIRKDVLLRAGGFHPDGMPKELIRFRGDGETHVSRFVAESGMKCLFHPGASVYHKVTQGRMTIDYFRQRGFNQGVSDSYTRLRNQEKSAQSDCSWPYRFARWGWHTLKAGQARFTTSADERRALQAMRQGHHEGFAYHQQAYRTDPEVREWVHRERYF